MFVTFTNRISRRSRVIGEVFFKQRQLSLQQFTAKCEAFGLKISTCIFEIKVLRQKRVECLLEVDDEILPQVEAFKYIGVL